MPAAYAHHSFGETCLEMMPERYKRLCYKYRELYDFGVHGPDLLFYYHPLSSNNVNQYGHQMHTQTGASVFQNFKEILNGKSGGMRKNERGPFVAYMLGFLAHFTFDSTAHAYINEMAASTEPSHNFIESQFESYLISNDGRDVLKYDRSGPLKPSMKNARVVSYVFPFTPKEILVCMKGQKRVLHLFYSPKEIKKNVIRSLIRLMKISGDFGDLFLDTEIIPVCRPMMEEISEMEGKAMELYPKLLKNLIYYLNDKEELSQSFQYDFEGILK